MHIVVNTRLLLKNKLEGIGWYTFETLTRITQNHPEHRFTFLFDRPFSDEFIFSDNVKGVVLSPPSRHPFLWYIWFQISVKRFLKRVKPDIFVSPDGYLPLNINIPKLAVIHDINFRHFPKDFPFWSKKYYNYFFPRFAKQADSIVTVSEFSKKDIIDAYQIKSEKIKVTYNGCNTIYKPALESTKQSIRKRLTGGSDYFIYIGALNPRKNILNLLKAFDLFKENYNNDFKLVIVGEKMFGTKPIESTYNNLKYKDNIVFTGRLNPEDLINVLGSAYALTFPSNFEGFGIPILEAFHCEVPVITSNVTSMPEVAGDAALLVDPFSVESITEAMLKLAGNEELKKELILRGNKQKELFSWDKTAEGLWQTIQKTV